MYKHKVNLKIPFLLASLFFLNSVLVQAQHFHDASEYINFIGKQHKKIAEGITVYAGMLAKGAGKKNEALRKDLLEQLKTANKRTTSLHPYKVDRSFQDSALHYYTVSYKVLNSEVPKILRLEDSLGTSYKATESYLKAKQHAINELARAEAGLNRYAKVFVNKYKIKEEYNDDDVYEQLVDINRVNSYYSTVYLTFLKCEKQETSLKKAIDKKDTTEMKRQNEALSGCIKDGLGTLDTLKSYNNDVELIGAAKQVFQFYQKETEFKVPSLLAAAKDNSQATAQPGEQVATFANTVKELETDRTAVISNWNNVSKRFLNKQVQ